jgi:hypothetical protein
MHVAVVLIILFWPMDTQPGRLAINNFDSYEQCETARAAFEKQAEMDHYSECIRHDKDT